jgi:hypothetical protein
MEESRIYKNGENKFKTIKKKWENNEFDESGDESINDKWI